MTAGSRKPARPAAPGSAATGQRLPPATPAGRKRRAAKSASRPAQKPVLLVLDSSCWLEFFADSPQADPYAKPLEDLGSVLVPVVVLYEVAKKLHREAGEEVAAAALALMQQAQVVPLDAALALDAAVNGLPLADSIIYATACRYGAELWTQDAHFEGLPGVRYFGKGSA